MNVKSVEKKENSAVELVIEIDAAEFDAAVEKVYRKRRGGIMVPGFRKGKAPRKIIEGMYGAGVFYEDAVDELYPETYQKAVEQEALEIASYPRVEILEVGKDGFSFKAIVTVRPEASISGHKGLTAPRDEAPVTEEDLNKELEPFVEKASRIVTAERPAQKGDIAIINYEGFKDGVPFEGGKAEGHELTLGSGSFIPGFEEQVEGMAPGEERELNVTFPEEYHAEELAGAPVVFKVKLCEVKEKQRPDLDDEFAKDVSEFDTLEDFKKDLSEKLAARRRQEADRAFENALMEQLIELVAAEIPDAMLEYEANKFVDDYAMRITSQGIPFEQYLQMMGMTRQNLLDQSKEPALRQVKGQLALEAVARAEGIEISDADADAEYESLAAQFSMEAARVKEMVPVKDIKGDLLRRKAMEAVKAAAVVGPAPEKKEAEGEKAAAKKTAAKKPAAKKSAGAGEDGAGEPAAKTSAKRKKSESEV